ncbi:MAG TPA: FtsX-like permease family protein, partial [Micromonosporaceae bacterium]
GAPARRAVVRWAWRLFRREWRQQLLVLVLIIVAVAATILGAAVASNAPPPADAGFGTANHLVTIPGTDPHLAADIAAIRQHFGTADVIENASLATGLAQIAQLRAQDPDGAYGRPMLALASGRYPAGANEVAMTAQLASTFGVQVGDLWANAGRELRVVGIVENPQSLLDNFALVAPGQVSAPDRVTVLFDATATSLAGFRFPAGTAAVTPVRSNGIAPAVIVFAIAIIGLIFVGLVAVAGFTVLAQRRLRALGMLSALGATDRNVRLVMVTNGAFVGVLGALIGAAVGLAAWIAYAPSLASRAHHRVTWTNLPWWLVASAIVLAVATATVASRRPARIVARVPVMAALSGRPPTARAVHRSAVPGAVVLVVATLMLAFSGGWGGNGGKDTLLQLVGLLATAVGLLLLAPLAVSLLGVAARRVPVAIRIALRDLARYRSRSGAALAATSFAILIAMLVTLITTGRYADPVDYFGPNLLANQVLVATAGNQPTGPKGTAVQSPAQTPAAQQAQTAAIAASLNSHDVLALDSIDAFLGRHTATGTIGGPGTIYLATPAVLAHYGIDPASVNPATLLVTSRSGLSGTRGLQLVGGGAGPDPQAVNDPRIQTFANLPTDTSAPNLLATERAVAALKLQVTANAAWLIQTPQALTSIQINTARQLAVAAGMTIETRSQAPSLAAVRNDATSAGILLVLGMLAMTIGLIRSETAGELRTLTATGASGHTRRAITAATAGALGLLGGILGTAVAYLATAAFFRSELSERMAHPPTLDLILILVGLPVLATAGGGLFGGRQPPALDRQPIE